MHQGLSKIQKKNPRLSEEPGGEEWGVRGASDQAAEKTRKFDGGACGQSSVKNSNSDTEEPEEEEVKEVEREEGDAADVIKKVEADVKAVENGDDDVSTFVAECFYTQVVFAPPPVTMTSQSSVILTTPPPPLLKPFTKLQPPPHLVITGSPPPAPQPRPWSSWTSGPALSKADSPSALR